jgi:putative membrane-bound dehydrogenase-like protein
MKGVFMLSSSSRRGVFAVAVIALAAGGGLSAAEPAAGPHRIVFLAGGRSHGPGEHEFHAGCQLLAKALNESGLPVKAEVIKGWPQDASVLDGAKALVFYSDATSVVGKGWEKTDALARAGTGVMFMHYAVHPSKADGEKYFRPWIGGAFEDGFSVNPHWVADLEALSGHPVARGISGPVKCFDEFYYNMRFRPNRGEVLDLATATPSRDRVIRYINLWNEHGVEGLGKKQTLMWGVERPDGGRGVGFTGGHYHRNWAIDGFRTLVLNAIVWTAGVEVPSGGVVSKAVSEDELNANLDDKGPNKPRLTVPTVAELAAMKPAEIQADREAKFAKPAAAKAADAAPAAGPANASVPAKAAAVGQPKTTPGVLWRSGVVTAATPGRAVDFDVDLGGARKIWLVVEDEGSYAMDWADWVSPRFVGPGGERPLTDLKWRSASTGWGDVRKDLNAAGRPMRVAGREERGIGTHAPSVIEFDVPEGMTRLVGRGGHDDGGAEQGDGGSVVFAVHSREPRAAAKAVARRSGPVDPADGPGTLDVADGLEATLFAGEPLLSSPSDIDVDAKGRVWACEVMNYRGKANTRAEGDRILVLEDGDGDGTADKQTVFHQGRDVDSALGICVIGEGPGRKVVVSCAPNVFVFHDDDGDLKADRKDVLFSHTGVAQHDHSVHAFMVGPDGRWYFNFGNTGKAVHDKDGKPVTERFGNVVNDSGKPYRQGMVFRCKPDGTDFEVLGHNFRNNYEVAVDSFGGLWQSDNDDDGNRGVRINFVMEYGNFGYVDERTGAGWQTPRTNLEPDSPERHWHLNDPGVVPNLLQTGGGSPTGICVYEGSLLPSRFHGSLIHCDAGPNVMRAYHVSPSGSGYRAESEVVIDGSADRWFRPSDVCVAPDGSLIVADWYDPGVGGHGMGDTQKGRIYRIAPVGSKWSVPPCDLATVAGAVAALASPNISARGTALERLAKEPAAAAPALAQAFDKATDARVRARLAWAAGMLPGQADAWIAKLAADKDENLRSIAIRMARRVQGDVLARVEAAADDPSPAVRREAALALKGVAGEQADRAWARLAGRHVAGDRWDVEALGIGADGTAGFKGPTQWDARLAAWLTAVNGNWKTPAGREIVWRSRGAATPAMLCELIADPSTTTNESLALLRALDFQDPERMRDAVRPLVTSFAAPEEKLRVVLPELVARLDRADAADPAVAKRIDETVAFVAGTDRFPELVARFQLKGRADELMSMAAAEGASEQVAANAAGLALDFGADGALRAAALTGDPAGLRLVNAVGVRGTPKALGLLKSILADASSSPEVRAAAVKALARSNTGAKDVVALARAGELTGSLPQVAAVAIASSPWGDVRQSAADVLPMPKAKGGSLPPVADLLKRGGRADRGKAVFAGVGTCAKCHVVGGEGKSVGPNLSGIGAKLSKSVLYESILAPSAAISHNFETYTAILADGRSVSGLLVSKSPEQVVIRGADGIDQTLPTGDVEELLKQPVSLMPADLAAVMSAEELVDLVAWLETLKQTN